MNKENIKKEFLKLKSETLENLLICKDYQSINGEDQIIKVYYFHNNIIKVSSLNKNAILELKNEKEDDKSFNYLDFLMDEERKRYKEIKKNFQKIITQSKIEQF